MRAKEKAKDSGVRSKKALGNDDYLDDDENPDEDSLDDDENSNDESPDDGDGSDDQ